MNENITVPPQKPHSSFLEKISVGILLVVVFLSPIFFVPNSFISAQFGISLLFAFGVIISLLVYIVSCLKTGTLELPLPWWYFLSIFIVVPLCYVISFFAHGFSRIQFLGYIFDVSTVGFIILSFVFTLLVSILFRTKERIFYSYIAVVVSALVVALFLVARMIFGVGFLGFGIFTSLTMTSIGSWDSVGIFFGIGVILSLLTIEMLSLTKAMNILATTSLVLSLFLLSSVNFSPIWIIVAITSILFGVYKVFSVHTVPATTVTAMSWSDRLQKIPKYTLCVFIIALIFVFWGTAISNTIDTRLGISNFDVRPTFSVTYDIAKNTLHNSPLFGSGPNTFALQWLSYKPADINTTIFWNTDFTYGVGLIPTFIITTGLLGMISWVLFFVVFLWFGFKALFQKDENTFSKYLTISSFFVSLYLWIMSCVYIPSVTIFVLTFFFTGLFFATIFEKGLVTSKRLIFATNPKVGFLSSLVLVVVSIGGVAVGYELYRNSLSLWYFQKASYVVNTSGSFDDAEKYVAAAIAHVPYDIYYRAQVDMSASKINTLFSQDLSKTNKADIQNFFSTELSKAITAGLAARNADRTNYLNWISLGQAYELGAAPSLNVAGAYDNAVLAYNQALKINPQNPAINLLFARLEIAKGDIKKAKEYTMTAIKQKQNYLDAYFLLSQLEVADKNLQGAIDSTTVAAIIDPSNPNTLFQLGLLKYNNNDFTGATDAFNKSLALAPDYANAKYFLGLSLVQTNQISLAIKQFEDILVTNPDSEEVKLILANLKAGKSPFTNAKPPVTSKPEKATTLPVKESQ